MKQDLKDMDDELWYVRRGGRGVEKDMKSL